ncbi:MAG: integrase [Oleiphilaceae bacterium]|jgi:integrase
MTTGTNRLTTITITNAKPKEKEYSLSDGGGLAVRIKPNGSKVWIFNYTHPTTHKRKNMGLGICSDVPLSDARDKRTELRQLLAKGIDPKAVKDKESRKKEEAALNTFQKVAETWLKIRQNEVTAKTLKTITNSLAQDVYPVLGKIAMNEITYNLGKQVIKRAIDRNSFELARKLASRINEVMDLAVRHELIKNNPLFSLKKDIPVVEVKHNSSLAPDELPELMKAINFASIELKTRCMLELKLHTLTRSQVVAMARWEQFDFDKMIWTIQPIEGTKVRRTAKNKQPFIIPMTNQVVSILELMKPISGHRDYVFPNHYDPQKHANKETMNTALKRMGLKGRTTAHGLRSLASTILNEQGFNIDVIEKALFHVDKNTIRKIYNRAEYLEPRKIMLSWWSEHIEQAANGNMSLANVRKTLYSVI